jgi:hypothetical protein
MAKIGVLYSLLFVLGSYVDGQELRRTDDVGPLRPLSRKMQLSFLAPKGGAGNFSMPNPDTFAHSSQLELFKRQSCSAGL